MREQPKMRKLTFRLDETTVFTTHDKRKHCFETWKLAFRLHETQIYDFGRFQTLAKRAKKLKKIIQKWSFRFDETQIHENRAKKREAKKHQKRAFRVDETALLLFLLLAMSTRRRDQSGHLA